MVSKQDLFNKFETFSSLVKGKYELVDYSITDESRKRWVIFSTNTDSTRGYHMNYPSQYTTKQLYDILDLMVEILSHETHFESETALDEVVI